jgi:sulfur carrier protein
MDGDAPTIELNGERRTLRAGASVRELVVETLRLPPDRVAVELNRELLPRAGWDRRLESGDRLEIVTFVGGG